MSKMAYPLHLLVVAALTAILVSMINAYSMDTPSYIIKYTTITGYFLQDDPTTNASTFDYVRTKTHPPSFSPFQTNPPY